MENYAFFQAPIISLPVDSLKITHEPRPRFPVQGHVLSIDGDTLNNSWWQRGIFEEYYWPSMSSWNPKFEDLGRWEIPPPPNTRPLVAKSVCPFFFFLCFTFRGVLWLFVRSRTLSEQRDWVGACTNVVVGALARHRKVVSQRVRSTRFLFFFFLFFPTLLLVFFFASWKIEKGREREEARERREGKRHNRQRDKSVICFCVAFINKFCVSVSGDLRCLEGFVFFTMVGSLTFAHLCWSQCFGRRCSVC